MGDVLKILIACEESQAVCKAFRDLGHEAYSCDTEICSGGHPEWHLQQDVLPLLDEDWDLIVAFPPCTFLTVTANCWYNIERYGEEANRRYNNRKNAINFFMKIMNCKCTKVAIENPVGVMSTRYKKPDQIIQPWMFGDPFEKRTCLWLKGLPKLEPTNVVKFPPRKVYKNGCTMPEWYSSIGFLPKKERMRIRSKTFKGVAQAMASQWGKL